MDIVVIRIQMILFLYFISEEGFVISFHFITFVVMFHMDLSEA